MRLQKEGGMVIKEYLTLFERGDCKVKVQFQNHQGRIEQTSMKPREILKLIRPSEDGFEEYLRFDEWIFRIEKYEIFPRENILMIHAIQ